MGKSTISMAIFNSKLFVHQRVTTRDFSQQPVVKSLAFLAPGGMEFPWNFWRFLTVSGLEIILAMMTSCYVWLCLIMFDDTGGPDMFQVGMREKSIGFPQMTSPTFSELGAVMFLLVKYLTIYTILMYNIYIYYIFITQQWATEEKKYSLQ